MTLGRSVADVIRNTAVYELTADDDEYIFERLIIPWLDQVSFPKALNRSVIGSMNDLVFQARVHIIEDVM